jgi:uncharacterized protein (TIGR03437 family)
MLVVAAPLALYAHYYGPDARYTTAPGDSKDPDGSRHACASVGCHTGSSQGGPIDAAGGNVTATFSSGNTYTPGGSPVTIMVTVSDKVNNHYGFQMTARLDSDQVNGQAGDFTAPSGMIVLCSDSSPKTTKGCPANAPVQFIDHSWPSDPATGTIGTTPYVFTWTPPATNVGPVHFYVAGNAVNNNGINDAGDHVYTNNYVLTPLVPFVCTNTAVPVITSIISASGYGGFSSFAPGSWLEIYGVNLSQNTRLWAGSDFNGVNAPAKLDGVSVKINGKDAAAILYIQSSPSQINVQAPADTATGPVAITVTNCNATSSPTMVTEAALVPGMLALPGWNVGGKQYMVAVFLDGVTFVGNTGLVSGLAFRPAKPGDTIVAYGIGFGDVMPSFAPGVIVTGQNRLTNLTISFGSTPATTTYAGLAPGFVGLYQFNITVPNVADGDYQINITVGSVKVPQTMFLTVHK